MQGFATFWISIAWAAVFVSLLTTRVTARLYVDDYASQGLAAEQQAQRSRDMREADRKPPPPTKRKTIDFLEFVDVDLFDSTVETAAAGARPRDVPAREAEDGGDVDPRKAEYDEHRRVHDPLSTVKPFDIDADIPVVAPVTIDQRQCSSYAEFLGPETELIDDRKGHLSAAAERRLNQKEPETWSIVQKVRLVTRDHGADSKDREPSEQSRLLCCTYTHKKRHERAFLAHVTWARRCDRHLIFTDTAGTPELAQVPPDDVVVLKFEGGESYHNMWQKTRAAFKYLASQDWVTRNFDFVFLGGDDAYVISENLRHFTALPEFAMLNEAGTPIHMGYRSVSRSYRGKKVMPIDKFTTAFISGAGSVLNMPALLLAANLFVTEEFCAPDVQTSAEDVYLSRCFEHAAIMPRDTRNVFGEDRFNTLSPAHLYYQSLDQGYSWWWRDYRDRQLPMGLDIAASDAILFHYMHPPQNKIMTDWLYPPPPTTEAPRTPAPPAELGDHDD